MRQCRLALWVVRVLDWGSVQIKVIQQQGKGRRNTRVCAVSFHQAETP